MPDMKADRTAPARSRKDSVPFTSRSLHEKGLSEVLFVAIGIALGLTCALFPWYIFFNQEKFGIRALRTGDDGQGQTAAAAPPRLGLGIPDESATVVPGALDFLATGVVPMRRKLSSPSPAPGVDEQPFPGDVVDFRVVHITNGRALMEDDSGLFVVQPGSRLPDNSRVSGIEQRNGRWVLIATEEASSSSGLEKIHSPSDARPAQD